MGEKPTSLPLIPWPQRVPSICLSSSSLHPMSLRPPQPEGASEDKGSGLGAQQASWAEWVGEMLGALCLDPLSPQGPQGHCPASTSLPSSLPPHSTHIQSGRSEVPPVSMGVKVTHQPPAGILAVGRHELCVFPAAILTPPKKLVYH